MVAGDPETGAEQFPAGGGAKGNHGAGLHQLQFPVEPTVGRP